MKNSNQIISILNKHKGGIFLIAVGIIAMYYFIYSPIEAMKNQVEIDYSFKMILIGPALFVMGLYLLVFTNGGKFSIENLSDKEKKMFYFAFIVGFAFGFLALYWFKNQLALNGYDTADL